MISSTITLTAYCGCALCCGSHAKHNLTATGTRPRAYITAAVPRSQRYLLGKTIWLRLQNGQQLAVTCEDLLGPAAKQNHLDLYLGRHAHRTALNFGKQVATVIN